MKTGIMLITVLLILFITGGAQAASVQSKTALSNQDLEKAETAICDLVADALRADLNTDIAFIAASELKAIDVPIAAGTVSSSDITSLVSYPDDPLAELSITGKIIRQALERAVSIYPQPNLGFIQVSGLEFAYDPSRNVGERVTSVTVGGAPIIDSRAYSVAMTNSMANGALGYWKVWSAGDVKNRYPDKSITKAIDSYFAAKKTIDYSTLGRISVAK